jgi:ABC-type transport system involved in multi-copper enzyme maturation permease subunit
LLLGPIFRWETAAIARRERNYVIRWVYGLVILTCFSFPLIYKSGLSSASELEHRELAAASMASFAAIVAGQALALFLAMPPLFAGAIAQEVERGNLLLLLASPLRSVEIVLGKLGPRLVHVALIVAVAVPVLGLLSLNGGVDEKLVLLADSVLLSSAFLAGSLAILISALSPGVRQAVLATYVVEILWLAAPALCDGIGAISPAAVRDWSAALGGLCAMITPANVLFELNTLPATIAGDFMTTILLQIGLGMSFVAVTAALLRPVAKGAGVFGWRLAPVSFLLSRRRLLPRPRCGTRSVVWKEMHVARSRVVTRLFVALAAVALLVPLGSTTWQLAAPAFRELSTAGLSSGRLMGAREEFNLFLRVTLVMTYIVSAIGLAVFSGTSMTYEKEKETWISLIATPLSAEEIVAQKLIGAAWRLRWPALAYLVLLSLGIAATAIHPIAGALNLVQVVMFLGFAACLAAYFSLRFRSSVYALGWTYFFLFMLNGGYLLGCILVRNFHAAVAFLVTPVVVGSSLATYADLDWFLRDHSGSSDAAGIAWLIVLNSAFYGISTVVLWFFCVREFDRAAGRPCREGMSGRSRLSRPRSAYRPVGKLLKDEQLPEIE